MTRVFVLGVALAIALAAAGAAHSTAPGANGLIVYAEEVHGRAQLFTIRPDGSDVKQVTHVVAAVNPDWAPNGRSIVFERESASAATIAVISADGTGLRRLTPWAYHGQPSYSPDGRSIVYERDISPTDNGVWLMRANGTGLRRITRNPFMKDGTCGCDTDPNFSPDGKLISFVRIKEDERLHALFVVRRDGTGLKQLTPYTWQVGIKHDWSPDGKAILVTTNADFARPGASANLVTIRPDGSGRRDLTGFEGGGQNAFAGSFSPDGKHIVFRLERAGTYSLAVIDRDGRNLRQLTTGTSPPRFIDWGTHR